jgi:hypothetical protein
LALDPLFAGYVGWIGLRWWVRVVVDVPVVIGVKRVVW